MTLGGDAGGPWGGNVVHAWRQVSGTAVALSATDAAKPAFAAPALAGPENLAFKLTVTGRGTSLTATDRVSVRIAAAAAVSSVVPASTPIDGDTYRRGETIGIAVGFAKPVTVTGTPQLALSVGTNTRQAAYVRGSGTGQLVFEYTVLQADADSDGIAIAADSLAPGTGAIADATGMAVLLGHPALAAQAAHRVDGSLTHAFNPTAGICGRTAPVRDGLLLAVRARTGDTALGCAQVTTTHLGALSGTLILAHKGIGTLKPGDFANLGGIAALQLDNNDLTALPAGVFEGLDDTLTVLQLHDNDLQTIPAGVFDRLTGLTTLSLHDNRLPSLPDRIFEGLMKLTQLSLNGNPGSADFKPTAKAGPAGGIDVPQGATTGITLGVEVPENGNDDPWGTNVTYAWSRTEGTGGTLTDATAAQAVFTPPATDGTHAFRLTVTGGGGVAGTSTVSVHVGAAGVPPMPVSAVVNGPTLTLTYSKNLQAEPPPASDSGKGQVYLAVVSVPGVRRNIEPVPPSAVEVMGRQVILTFKPSIDPNRVVTLSYFPDNATAESRIRDRGGNLADGFAGLRVRNVLSEGPVVRDIAFAGAAKTYGIGDTVGIDVTFSDPVAVTVTGGAPTLALEIGSANRKARWKAGQAAGAVQRFEYTVAEGEEDTDGIAVKADGLAVPSRSSILTTAEREAVILGHGRVHDPAHKVDGVRPTVPPSQTVPGDARATAASISSSPSSGSTYRAGETVTVRLAMNEAVLVTGRPHILLDVGGVRRRAVYSGPIGSSTDVLDFSYTVQAGDLDTDGVGLCVAGRRPGCGSIDLNGGSIRAAGDESAASLGHPALAAQSGHKVDAAPLPALSTACADDIRVRIDWALKPSSVSAGGTFRLLFVGSVDRNAQSSNIADYNRFVQSLAAAGHSSIRPFKGGFRAVGSTAAVDARDNTCTTGTGVPIHWLNGNQVADNYADFYDNSWDDQANPKTESGNAIGPRNVWTGSNSDGTNGGQPLGNTPGGGRLIRLGTIGQSGGGGSPLSASSALASSSGSALAFYGLSQVFKVPAASDKARTTDIAIISSPAIGDAYRLGETVEVEVMYSEAVTVRGAPLVGLSVKNATGNDDNEYDAAYVRGSGTTKLVFSFTVPSGLRDDDGIQLYSSPLRLNGATITAVSDGDPAVWNLAAERNIGGKVDSSRTPSGGICSRTPQVRDAIVAAVAAASDCSQVTNAYLTALTGTLEFSGLTSIAAGDLAGLSSLTRLNLYGSGIETLPVGLFDGLGSLTRLDVRAGLTHLPKDIFRGLGKVTFLSLDGLEYPESPGNRLREGGLPDGIFEPLSRDVKEFWIFGSPGSESFRPRAADAGPGGMLSAGQKVTLGGPGNDGGPWGSNVFYRWRQKDGSGNAVSTVALPVTDEVNVVANPSFTVPTLAETTEVRFQLRLDGAGKKLDGGAHGDASLRLGLYSPVSEARFTILALAPTGVAVVSKPVDGDTYRQGEKIEVAVTFGDRVLVDTSLGTPTLGLAVGTETRQATYVRGTGSNRLVFEYTVQSGDTDGDGIAVAANGLAPGGGAIAGFYGVQAILDHAALAAQTGHKVGGSLTHSFDLTRGVCERTPQVRDKLLELVKAKPGNSGIANCSEVDPEMHLPTLTGTLDLSSAGIATLKQGDFANLGGIDILRLQGNDLTALPASVFDGLTGLSLIINLRNNNLSSLPPRIFEKLTGLTGLSLNDNPGSAGFVPTAKAGPAGGIEVVSGGSVTLGVEGAENGHDDPWGSNVTWSWSRTGGAGGTLTDAAAARATFTAPATGEDGTHVFRLKVIGAGDFAATADVAIRVAAGPKAVEAAFAPVGGTAYAGGETIEVALHFDRAVTVDIAGGTPSVTLTVGAAPRTAGYLRGSDTRVLTFGYTVQAADMDADGVDLVANSLALNGGKIAAVSDGGVAVLGHAALAGGSGRTVNSPTAGGICDRTAAVQTAILERVRADENDASLQCGDIGPVRLVAIGGRLDLSAQARNGRMTALRAGDFAWLANVTGLDLDNHALRSFPAGVFDPLTALSELSIAYNQTQAADRLTSLPAGLFDGLTKLTTLRLEHNDLETLPDGIFEKLTRLTTLTLHGNPGSAAFLPVAAAGPAGGLEAETGERVTLGGDAGGPWGGNVVHAWRQVSGTAVALSATDAAKPAFAAPALAGPEESGVQADGHRARHEPDRDGQGERAHRGGGGGVVGGPGLDADRRGHLPPGRDDRDRGRLREAGDGDGDAAAGTVGGDEHAPGGLCPRFRDRSAGVRIHRGAGRCRQRRYRHRGGQPGARHWRDRGRHWHGGAARPPGAGGAGGPQGGRVADPCVQPDGRHLRAHGAGARWAAAGGPGPDRRHGARLRAGDDHASRRAKRNADPGAQGDRDPQAGGLRQSRRDRRPAARQQRSDGPACRRVRGAGRHADRTPAARQRSADDSGWRLRPVDRADNAQPARQPPSVAAGPHLRGADETHPAVAERQPRQRGLQADREGRAGGRDRCAPGRHHRHHPRGRGPGERQRRPLGDQRHVCLVPDGGHRRNPDGCHGGPSGLHPAGDGRDACVPPHGHRWRWRCRHLHRFRPCRRGGGAADAGQRGGERPDTDADLQQEPPGRASPGLGLGQGSGLSRGGERAGGAAQHRAGASERGRGDGKAGDPDLQTVDRPQPGRDALLLPGQRHGGEPDPRSGRQPGRRLHRAAGGQRHARGQYRPELRRHRPREDLQDRRHDRDRTDLRGSGDRGRDGRRAHPGAGDWRRAAQGGLCPGLRQRRPHVRIHSGRPGRGGHGRHRGRGERAGGSRRQLHPQHGGSRGGDPAPRPGPRPGAQGGRRAPGRRRRVGRRSDGHGDLVGGAGRGVGAHGRRRVHGCGSATRTVRR